ncbi:MAG: N-acetyl sugar amidotransferase [Alphaproteobacteria bacterium]
MRYCKRCLEPDTRPDCVFDAEGICLPCRYQERLHEIDWAARRRELDEIAAWAKTTNVSGYDCIIPVSGGKDSHRQALFARDELGMRPLLVSCAYPPEEQTERGAANLANLIGLGFDAHVVSPAPQTWKALMRFAFRRFGNFYKVTELALYATAPKFALMFQIPLLIYGENPALSWGSAGGSFDGDANRMKYSNTLQGGDISPYVAAGFDPAEMFWYRYPSDQDIARAGLRMIYLGYYMADFNDLTNGRIAVEHGLQPRLGEDAVLEEIGQITTYDALDCDFVQVNQMLKYVKLGFGKASEQASGMVRAGRMTRDEAVAVARRYDGKVGHRYIRRLCDFLQISEDEFWDVVERFRNHDIFERDGNEWRHRYPLA